MKEQKCPFFSRRIGAYNWKGIKCTSEKWPHGLTKGDLERWEKEDRESYIDKYCFGCFDKCHHFNNHGGWSSVRN